MASIRKAKKPALKGDYTPVKVANAYIEDVLSGKVDAGKLVHAACRRQVEDLQRKDFRWRFDKEAASRVVRFVELLHHVKGEWALEAKLLVMAPWMCFILTTVFGWVDKKTRFRRFRMVYFEVPRKNAKTTISAAVALYAFLADREAGAEVYNAATTRTQARIAFNIARSMVRKNSALRSHYGVKTYRYSLAVERTDSVFEALSSDGDTLDGLNPHFALVDEFHAHKKRDVYEVIRSGVGARKQSLVWLITTAGTDFAGICFELRGYAETNLTAPWTERDETFFSIIYTLDKEDDWRTEKAWRKANPNYGISVDPDDMLSQVRRAINVPSARNSVLTKHFNIWCNATELWVSAEAWEARGNAKLEKKDFHGCPCWIGVDLASLKDMAAVVYLFVTEANEYVAFFDFYLPEETVQLSSNASYDGWASEGLITTTPGFTIDFEVIEDDIEAFAEADDTTLQEITYDPFQATSFSTRMTNKGLTLVKVEHQVAKLSEPMKKVEAAILDSVFHHDSNPVMKWMISNTLCIRDYKENIYPRKPSADKKNDGTVALIMAFSRAMLWVEGNGGNSGSMV